MSNIELHKQSKTNLQVTKKIPLSGLIDERLENEFTRRWKDLQTTQSLILKELSGIPDLRGIKLSRAEIIMQNGIQADVSYSISVDGQYENAKKKPTRYIEASTLNLLINNKILTEEEKRALLKSYDLLPDVTLDI